MPTSNEPSSPAADPKLGPCQADLAGSFVYKFEGNAMRNDVLHRICGIGSFTLDRAGQLTGSHTSSGTPLQGSVKTVLVGMFNLTGSMLLEGGTPLGNADIVFHSETQGLDSVNGRFRFALAGSPDQLWLMSTGATILGRPEITSISELVMIEAIRLPGA